MTKYIIINDFAEINRFYLYYTSIYLAFNSATFSAQVSISSRIFSSIFSIFYFFMRNGEYMDNSRIGKALQFIGRRTLDVYLLHYFFVNNSMAWVKTFNFNSPTIIFIISIATSLVIIGICLLVSKFLRTNDLLGKILFGAKLPQKASQNS